MFMKLSQDYYPELLFRLYIVNAPVIFRAVWAIIKHYLDEKTRKKVVILKKPKLKHFADEIGSQIGGLKMWI